MAKRKKSLWENNEIQFARLICEINAAVSISKKDWRSLCDSMDLNDDEVRSLFDRAHDVFEKAKKF